MLLARIKQLREELNVQQRQMADAIGVDAPMYSRIERGIRPFRDEYIEPMAKILKVDEDELRSLWTQIKSSMSQRTSQTVWLSERSILRRVR